MSVMANHRKCLLDSRNLKPKLLTITPLIISVVLVILCPGADSTLDSSKKTSFPLGSSFVYNYEAAFSAAPMADGYPSVDGNLKATVSVETIWEDKAETLLRLSVKKASYDTSLDKVGGPVTELADALIFHDADKQVIEILVSKEGRTEATNLLRGFASLLILDNEESNDCQTRRTSGTVEKLCGRGVSQDKGLLGLSWRHEYSAKATLLDQSSSYGVPDTTEATETYQEWPTISANSVGFKVTSKQSLQLKEQGDSNASHASSAKTVSEVAIQILGKDFARLPLDVAQDEVPKKLKSGNVKNVVNSLKKKLMSRSLAKLEAVEAYVKVFIAIRAAGQADPEVAAKDVSAIILDKRNKEIIPQLMDVFGYLSLDWLHDVVMPKVNSESLERYLWALSQQPRPSSSVIKSVLDLAKSKKYASTSKLGQTILTTLASTAGKSQDEELLLSVSRYLLDSLRGCNEVDCKLTFLRSMQGSAAANLPWVTQEALRVAAEETGVNRKVAVEAIKIVQSCRTSHLDDRAASVLFTLFSDDNVDTVIRSLSAETLLRSHPSSSTFHGLLAKVRSLTKSSVSVKEMSSFVVSRILEYSAHDDYFQHLVNSAKKSGMLGWDLLSLPGSGISTSFSRSIMPQTSSSESEASFSFAMEVAGSVFKRSSLEFWLGSGDNRQQILKLDSSAAGLSSYLESGSGSAEATADAQEEATARMELSVLGSPLRPFIFFESASDLMSKYWSGALNEKATALQGTQPIQDSESFVPLKSGAFIRSGALGVLSYDFSGKAEFSIWDKTCKTTVEDSVIYSMKHNADFILPLTDVSLGLVQIVETPKACRLDVESDMDFSDSDGSGAKLCIKMVVAPIDARSSVERSITKGNTKENLSKSANVLWESKIPGRTLMLDRNNCELCNKMFPKKSP